MLGITSFRPFPAQAVRDALNGDRRLRRLVVIERALAPGSGGIVTADLRAALAGADGGTPLAGNTLISTVVAGLGGRPVTGKSLRPAFIAAQHGALPPFSFLDLREELALHTEMPGTVSAPGISRVCRQ